MANYLMYDLMNSDEYHVSFYHCKLKGDPNPSWVEKGILPEQAMRQIYETTFGLDHTDSLALILY